MEDPNAIYCPYCQSENVKCWDEIDHVFEDVKTGDWYEAPVGYFKCLRCLHTFAHHWEGENEIIPDAGFASEYTGYRG
jgi:hypothetical protein